MSDEQRESAVADTGNSSFIPPKDSDELQNSGEQKTPEHDEVSYSHLQQQSTSEAQQPIERKMFESDQQTSSPNLSLESAGDVLSPVKQNMDDNNEPTSPPSAMSTAFDGDVQQSTDPKSEHEQLSDPQPAMLSDLHVQRPTEPTTPEMEQPTDPSYSSSKEPTVDVHLSTEPERPEDKEPSSQQSLEPRGFDETLQPFGMERPGSTDYSSSQTSTLTDPVASKQVSATPIKDNRKPWEKAKENYMNMDKTEKRKEYMCGNNYCEYNDVNFPGASKRVSDKDVYDKIAVWRGDITTLEFDAIVNAANERMRGGGGVDGAIHRAAGPMLIKESIARHPHGCDTGQAKMTGGYKLPAKYVIHTVGPRDRSPKKLRQCYESVLQLVYEKNIQHVAIPCISTGIFGYPNKDAADVAFDTVTKWLRVHTEFNGLIVFCVFLPNDEEIYKKLLQGPPPITPDSSAAAGTADSATTSTKMGSAQSLLGKTVHCFTEAFKLLLAIILWFMWRVVQFVMKVLLALKYVSLWLLRLPRKAICSIVTWLTADTPSIHVEEVCAEMEN